MSRPGFLLLGSLLSCAHSASPRTSPVIQGDVATRIDQFLTTLAAHRVFAGQVLIARNDSVLLSRGYGFADRAQGIPVDPETRFDLASLSKQFTGALFLKLAAQGRLSLQDSLGRFFPAIPEDKRAITLEQLLSHTSGLARDFEALPHRLRLPFSRDSALQATFDAPVNNPPGKTFDYSNLGYTLLAAVAEQATRRPFQELVHEQLFGPAELQRTGFQSDTRKRPGVDAHGYWDLYDAGSARERPDSWYGLGGSQVVSTASDLLQWFRALRRGAVLDSAGFRNFLSPDSGAYRYGWYILRRRDSSIAVVYHPGATNEAQGSEMRWYPRLSMVVIVLTNTQLRDIRMQEDVIANISDFAAGRDTLPSLPAARKLDSGGSVAGQYSTAEGGHFTVWREPGGDLWLAPEDSAAFQNLNRDDSAAARSAALASTRALVDSLKQNRCDRPPAPRAPAPQVFRVEWDDFHCGLIRELGPRKSHLLLGATRLSWSRKEQPRILVYSRLGFERGERLVTWLWEGPELIESWIDRRVTYPQSIPLVFQEGRTFLSFDWFTGRSLTVVLEPGSRLEIRHPSR